MNNKTKSIGAIGLILGGLILAIVMFVIFLNKEKEISKLNDQLIVKSAEYESLYQDCLKKTEQLEGIDQAEIAAAAKKAENGQFHLGISWPTLTQKEGGDLLVLLKNEGFNIYYENEKTADLGNMYYYNNGVTKAEELKELIYSKFPRIRLNVKAGGSGSSIPSGIRDNTIIIKI